MDISEMIFISSVGLVLLILLIMCTCIPWITHRDMTKKYAKLGLVNASYKEFVKEFDKIDWKRNPMFTESLYHFESESELHASIFRINGIGMKMRTPFSYAKARKYIDKKLLSGQYGWLNPYF